MPANRCVPGNGVYWTLPLFVGRVFFKQMVVKANVNYTSSHSSTVRWVSYRTKPDHLPSSLHLRGRDTSLGLTAVLSPALTLSPCNLSSLVSCLSFLPPLRLLPLPFEVGFRVSRQKRGRKTPYPPWHSWYGAGHDATGVELRRFDQRRERRLPLCCRSSLPRGRRQQQQQQQQQRSPLPSNGGATSRPVGSAHLLSLQRLWSGLLVSSHTANRVARVECTRSSLNVRIPLSASVTPLASL